MPALTVTPASGGQLITRAAAADAGIAHYTKKRLWRRDLSDEILREGHDYFNPLPDEDDYQTFPFPDPSGAALKLIHVVRRPNGEAAIIAGTQTTLYRFNTNLLGYFEDPPLYVDGVNDGPSGAFQPYFEEPTRWQIIGSGFSASGRRWEVVDINGTTIFNNGVDLPVAYRVEWRSVVPLYELREQGVVCVGTISESNGILVAGDVTELQEDDLDTVLNVIKSGDVLIEQAGYRDSNGIPATSTGTIVTATTNFFEPGDVGRILVWWNNQRQTITGYTSPTQVTVAAGTAIPDLMTFRITDDINAADPKAYKITADAAFFTSAHVGLLIAWPDGSVRKITKFIDSQTVKTDTDIPVAESEAFIENPITYYSKTALEAHWLSTFEAPIAFDRRQYRLIWSEVFEPTKHAIRIPVTLETGSKVLLTERMNKSLFVADQVAVEGAGQSGGVLLADVDGNPVTLTAVGPGVMQISHVAITGGEGAIQRSSSIGSIVGFHDLQDDGAAILKMAFLFNRLVIYTDTNIFLAVYTAVVENPFEFERVKVPHGHSLYYRNTLVTIGGRLHVYAGKNRFYQFDLTNRMPTPIPAADLVSNLFYDYASIDDTESIYAADNHNTKEIWIVCPDNPTDPTLCFDYIYSTFSTTDFVPTCAATTKEAVWPLVGETGDWFLMGTANGTLLVYGLTTEPMAAWPITAAWEDGRRIYYRRQARPYSATKSTYTARLASGLNPFGDTYNEKHVTSYVLQCSSQQVPSPDVWVYFYSAINQSAPEVQEGVIGIADADNHGLVPLHFIGHYFKDEVVAEVQYPVRLHSRTWDFYPVRSRSHHRKP